MSGVGSVQVFTYRSAQSRTLVVAITGIILIETMVLHLWIATRSPFVAWALSLASLASLLWFWRDDARYRAGAIHVDAANIGVAMGRRWLGVIPRELVESVTRPSWRDLPTTGSPEAATFVNVTKPAVPNVLVLLRDETSLRAFGMVTKRVRRIGIHLDAPDDFMQRLNDSGAR